MGHTTSLRRFILLLFVLVAGCSRAPATNESMSPTTTSQAVIASRTATAIPSADATATQLSTSTPSLPSTAASGSPSSVAPTSIPARFTGKIDVGGYKLQIRCIGEGSPTVVFDAGLGGSSLTWVQPVGISPFQTTGTFTRACIYDRAGVGESERGAPPRHSKQIVRDLHALLTNAAISPPFVLVGHSFGGHNVRLYTSQYPSEVAGMVLVDVSHEDLDARWQEVAPADERERIRTKIFNMGANDEGVDLEASSSQVRQARAASPFPPIPLVVLSAGRPVLPRDLSSDQQAKLRQILHELHADLARLSPKGKQVIAERSDHFIKEDQPELVVETIREVVEVARAEISSKPSLVVTAAPLQPTPLPSPTTAASAVADLSRADYQTLVRLFDYDQQAPLDVEEQTVHDIGGAKVYQLSYASPRGGRVPGYLVVPSGAGPFAGVIMMHGMPGRAVELLEYAVDLSRTGAVTLLIDAPWARRAGEPLTFTAQDRDEHIQLIVDLRRSIDLLASRPDVDSTRLGYIGISYGGAMGGLLAGVEQRIKAYVLAVGDGGLVDRFTGDDGPSGPLRTVPEQQQKEWIAVMEPIQPLHFVGHAAPATLFFQSAQRDQLVSRDEATRFHEAASEPKRIEWYNADHRLNEQAIRDQVEWLGEQIGIDAAKFAMFEP